MRWTLYQQSLVFVFCLFCLDRPLAFYQLKFQGWVIPLVAALPVPSSPAFRSGFYCDQEDRTSGSPLGGTFQFSGTILGVLPLPLHHLSCSVPASFQ